MKLAIVLINIVFTILKEIGDFVLFYVLVLLKGAKFVFKLTKNLLAKSGKSLKKSQVKLAKRLKLNKLKLKEKVSLVNFRRFLLFKNIKRKISNAKRRRAEKKAEKQNLVTIYPTPKYRLLKAKYFVFGFLFCVIFLLIPFGIYVFLNSLPNPKQLSEREIPQTTKIFDRNGILLYQVYANENRTLVPLSSLPKDLINATIAIEDKDFYKNPGFDITAITRAAIADFSGKSIQGGSTITQQLIKSTLLTPEISIERKIKEIVLAFWAEHLYSKDQILEMYFNQVPYGGTAWGIEAASETYFGKNVKDLDLAQSAFLAGMPQAPSTYSPYGQSPDLWKKRQKDVLNKMVALKFISKNAQGDALNQALTFRLPQTPIYAPHFVMYVKDLLIQKFGLPLVEKGGLNVITSLDVKLQNKIQDVVTEEVLNDAYLSLTNGAALVTNPKNGDILAMVGSKDYDDPSGGNVNLTTAQRQPGSSIKLVTYSAALSNGFTAATILDDSPITYNIPGSPSYSPVNYDGAFHGRVPLRIAFANSFNIPAVKTLQKIGIPTMVSMGKKMGITTWGDPESYGLSITLGAAEVKMVDLATAYGTIANLGKKVNLDPILKVSDFQNDIVYEKKQQLPNQVVDPGVAYIISNILADNLARSLEFGSNSPLNIPGRTVSVKTGTTDNKRDNWTIGFTPDYLTAVWVGNNDNSPMSQSLASGITGAAPIWNKIMSDLLANIPNTALKQPENITIRTCFGKVEYFIKGTETACGNISTPSGGLIRR